MDSKAEEPKSEPIQRSSSGCWSLFTGRRFLAKETGQNLNPQLFGWPPPFFGRSNPVSVTTNNNITLISSKKLIEKYEVFSSSAGLLRFLQRSENFSAVHSLMQIFANQHFPEFVCATLESHRNALSQMSEHGNKPNCFGETLQGLNPPLFRNLCDFKVTKNLYGAKM